MGQSILVQLLDESAMGYISDSNNSAAMDRYMRIRAEAQNRCLLPGGRHAGSKMGAFAQSSIRDYLHRFFPDCPILMYDAYGYGDHQKAILWVGFGYLYGNRSVPF